MNSDEYRQFLLETIPSARPASGGKFVQCRCFECGDSKDPTHAHMYIAIPQNEGELSWAYCHKCKMSCIMTPDILSKWGIYDMGMAKELAYHNKVSFSKPQNRIYMSRNVYRIRNDYVTDCRMSELKLKYINNRLGTNMDYAEALSKKIVLNLGDLLYANNITQYTRHPNIMSQLNDYFVGFISSDNAFVNMRRIVGEGKVFHSIDKRYIRYNLFDKYENLEKFYTIPANVDLASPNRIRVNVSEGELDILSVYYNLVRDPNQVYIAIGGSGYVGLMRYILTKLKLVYFELHLYPDNDAVGTEELDYIRDLLRPYRIPITIHINAKPGEKDFGVPLNRIEERIL
jgi:hypothetical protein